MHTNCSRATSTYLKRPNAGDTAMLRRTLPMLVLSFSIAATTTHAADAPKKVEPERINLWNGQAPTGDGKFEKGDVRITVHRPEKANGAAIVICPGGGYGGLVTGPEGHGIAAWLNRHGITGVVLEYRLPAGRSFVPLLDAQRAIRTVRANAKAWGLDSTKIGIMGFSAGGHLASTAGTHFDDGDPKASDPIDRIGCRPDFMILVYPVITMGEKTHGGSRNNLLGKNPDAKLVELFSNEKQVTPKTPPAFLAHAKDDRPVVPDNSKAFYDALQAQSVRAEYLELPSGGHGLNGYKGPMWEAWQEKSLTWLAEMKFLPAAEKNTRADDAAVARADEQKPAKVRILLLGDSTVIGSVCRREAPKADHLEDVIRKLLAAEADLPPTEVVNQGRDGEFIQGLLQGRYEKEIAKLPKVDVVLIRYGLNDIGRRQDFAANFPRDYRDLIQQLKKDHAGCQIVLETVIPYFSEAQDKQINDLVREVATSEKLPLLDTHARYAAELKHGANMLTYRRLASDKVPAKYRELFPVQPKGGTVVVLDNHLDVHMRDVPGWFADRHPNLAGYHVIGDEASRFLAPLLRARMKAAAKP